MYINSDPSAAPKQGFLQGEFRLFHIEDKVQRAYEPHCHGFLKIVAPLEGNVTCIIEGRSYSLYPGDIVLIDREQIHCPQAGASSPCERPILYLSPDFLDWYREDASSLDNCFSTATYHHSNVLRLKDEARHLTISLLEKLEHVQSWQEEEFAGPLYCHLLCLQFLVELNRMSLGDNTRCFPNDALSCHVSDPTSCANEHLCKNLDIRSLSVLNCVGPYHMMRIFKEEIGYTIGNYTAEKCLLRARSLLAEGTGATQACYPSGFNDYSTFLRAYRQHFGELPKRSVCAKKT